MHPHQNTPQLLNYAAQLSCKHFLSMKSFEFANVLNMLPLGWENDEVTVKMFWVWCWLRRFRKISREWVDSCGIF